MHTLILPPLRIPKFSRHLLLDSSALRCAHQPPALSCAAGGRPDMAPELPPASSSLAPPDLLLPGGSSAAPRCHCVGSQATEAKSRAVAAGLAPPRSHRPSLRVFFAATVALCLISRRGDALSSRCALLLKRRLKNYACHIDVAPAIHQSYFFCHKWRIVSFHRWNWKHELYHSWISVCLYQWNILCSISMFFLKNVSFVIVIYFLVL
jgi:hypothetical protein